MTKRSRYMHPTLDPYRPAVFVAILAFLCLQTGCQLMQPVRELSKETRRVFRPRPFDYYDSSREADDDWARIAAEARSYRPKEKEPDPLWKHLASNRALSIERSVSIEQ